MILGQALLRLGELIAMGLVRHGVIIMVGSHVANCVAAVLLQATKNSARILGHLLWTVQQVMLIWGCPHHQSIWRGIYLLCLEGQRLPVGPANGRCKTAHDWRPADFLAQHNTQHMYKLTSIP